MIRLRYDSSIQRGQLGISNKVKQEIFFIGLLDESNLPIHCPKCKGSDQFDDEKEHRPDKILKGPFTRFRKRDSELYFDLEEKYLECPYCSTEITVIDFQVLVDQISATLPPEKARTFSMKIMDLYNESRDYAIEVLSILTGDLTAEPKCETDYLKQLEELIQSED